MTMRLPHDALVLVADGRKMLFLRNHGDAEQIDLRVESHREQDNPYDRDQKSDAPGTGNPSVGIGRDTFEEVDFHQLAEDRFAAEAAEALRRKALGDAFDALLVIAPPRTLGELRKHYHKEVEKRLIGEIDKDLTGHTIPAIEQVLALVQPAASQTAG
jgi:protein required for attachment to host cells